MTRYRVTTSSGAVEVAGHSFVFENMGPLEIRDEAGNPLHVFQSMAWHGITTIDPDPFSAATQAVAG